MLAPLIPDGVPVVLDHFAPEFRSRHPSVQRWWSRVLRHLGEDERGERAYWMVAGVLRVHPNNASTLLRFVSGAGPWKEQAS
jgi:hypothetical protein